MDTRVQKGVVATACLLATAGFMLDVTGWPGRDTSRDHFVSTEGVGMPRQAAQACQDVSHLLDARADLLSVDGDATSASCAWVVPSQHPPGARQCPDDGRDPQALDVIQAEVSDGAIVELEQFENEAIVCNRTR